MHWGTTFKKAALGALTFASAFLAANPAVITRLIPSDWVNMSVGAAAAAMIVGTTNWLKNRLGK